MLSSVLYPPPLYHRCRCPSSSLSKNNKIGHAAVPLSMTVLGANLSAVIFANNSTTAPTTRISNYTIASILISKMIVMPMIGISTVWIIKTFLWNVPSRKFYCAQLVLFVSSKHHKTLIVCFHVLL